MTSSSVHCVSQADHATMPTREGPDEGSKLCIRPLTLPLFQREGGTLNCAPSAVADAGNGAPLNWRASADAGAGGGERKGPSRRPPRRHRHPPPSHPPPPLHPTP